MFAAIVFSLKELNDKLGGKISPFWLPEIVTSTPHSSCAYSSEARPELVSTIKRAGWFARTIAVRTAALGNTDPVDV